MLTRAVSIPSTPTSPEIGADISSVGTSLSYLPYSFFIVPTEDWTLLIPTFLLTAS